MSIIYSNNGGNLFTPIQQEISFYTHCQTCGNAYLGKDIKIKVQNDEAGSYDENTNAIKNGKVTIFLPHGWHGFISDEGLEISEPEGKLFKVLDGEGTFRIVFNEDQYQPPIILKAQHECPTPSKPEKEIFTADEILEMWETEGEKNFYSGVSNTK